MKKLLIGLFLFAALGAQAQQMTADEQAEAIRQLTEEVNTLKTKQSTWEKVKSALPTFSGFMQMRYTYNGDESDFKFRRIRMSMTGTVAKKVDYKLQVELSSFKLIDAYVDYKPFEALKIKAGQFKIPFLIENTDYSPIKMELLDYPMALQKLIGFSEKVGEGTISATGREMGISLHGDIANKILSYDVALFNGSGINTSDNNKSKDVAARLMLRPVTGLTLAASYYWGEYGSAYYARERYGFAACYDNGPIVARAEYIAGKTGFADGDIDSDGFNVVAGYRFCKKWMAAARFDTYTENTAMRSATKQNNYTAGLGWYPTKFLRLQVDYVHEDMAVGNRNVLMTQLTASF